MQRRLNYRWNVFTTELLLLFICLWIGIQIYDEYLSENVSSSFEKVAARPYKRHIAVCACGIVAFGATLKYARGRFSSLNSTHSRSLSRIFDAVIII